MEELKKLLAQTDEEYLVGLSNKGTVKRAAKDLEQETPAVTWGEKEAEVAFKEAVCRIRAPLGDGSCSCPSRSMCRHRIAAMLYLKRVIEKEASKNGAAGAEAEQNQNPEAAPLSLLSPDLEQELLDFPLDKLRQACRAKGWRELASHIGAGEQPEMETGSSGSLLTVRFPWQDAVVKLLSPLEHSACTCHSRELCVHKAQAILTYQLQKGVVRLEELRTQVKDDGAWDLEELLRAARSMKEGISLQLLTGLSRLSPEASESMERLAVISHGAGLADFETGFRSAALEYQQYFQRSGAFRTEMLLGRLLDLYHRAQILGKTTEPEKLRALAGTFRDTYTPVPRLHLTAIGGRSFKSKAGYEGERYYFLEIDQKKWYTWTDARPIFYETVRRRPMGNTEREQAPWGLGCSRAEMLELEFYLNEAKAAAGGRLSVSKETKSEIVGQRELGQEAIQEMVVFDYRRLLEMLAGDFGGTETAEDSEQKAAGRETLALVEAARCGEGYFDSVQQRFSMDIFDRAGRKLSVAVKYSKEERLTIRVLERLSEGLKKRGEKGRPLVFFGALYLEGGNLCLYPIEYFDREKFGQMAEEITGTEEKQHLCSLETVRLLEGHLRELRQALADVFQSGLASVQEESLSELKRLAKESEELGLHGASGELAALCGMLEEKRHQTKDFDPEPAIDTFARLMEYIQACLKKVSYDQARISMEAEQENGRY